MTSTDPASAIARLGQLPGVGDGVEQVREACTRLRFHEGLRRRIPEAAAESRVRGARASAALDGAALPVAVVRDLARGARDWPAQPDPVERVVRAALRVVSATENIGAEAMTAPLGVLARLSVAAGAGLADAAAGAGAGSDAGAGAHAHADAKGGAGAGAGLAAAEVRLGRPRREGDPVPGELADLAPVPGAAEAHARLQGVVPLLAAVAAGASAPVALAVVHAELAWARPFAAGNALVARGLDRALLRASGLDPTGVAVPEAGLESLGPGYAGALVAYGSAGVDGVALWLRTWCQAMVAGVAEGERVADAVRRGQLGEQA